MPLKPCLNSVSCPTSVVDARDDPFAHHPYGGSAAADDEERTSSPAGLVRSNSYVDYSALPYHHAAQHTVHFPPSPVLASTHVVDSARAYDRRPIIVSENVCALPKRGCPGRTYASIDGIGRGLRAVLCPKMALAASMGASRNLPLDPSATTLNSNSTRPAPPSPLSYYEEPQDSDAYGAAGSIPANDSSNYPSINPYSPQHSPSLQSVPSLVHDDAGHSSSEESDSGGWAYSQQVTPAPSWSSECAVGVACIPSCTPSVHSPLCPDFARVEPSSIVLGDRVGDQALPETVTRARLRQELLAKATSSSWDSTSCFDGF